MTLGKREIAILCGLAEDVETLAAKTAPASYVFTEQRKAIERAREGIAVMDPGRWLGREMSASQAVMNCRAYKKLATAGMIEKVSLGLDGRRTTHLKITEAGKSFVKEITNSTLQETPK